MKKKPALKLVVTSPNEIRQLMPPENLPSEMFIGNEEPAVLNSPVNYYKTILQY